MSNVGLELYLESLGLRLHRTDVGDRHVTHCMRSGSYNLGGEPSGHIIIGDHATTGDALLTALQVLFHLKQAGEPASKLCRGFELVPQENFEILFSEDQLPDDTHLEHVWQVASSILSGEGRSIVRRSGTEPSLVRVTVESKDDKLRKSAFENILNMFKVAL